MYIFSYSVFRFLVVSFCAGFPVDQTEDFRVDGTKFFRERLLVF